MTAAVSTAEVGLTDRTSLKNWLLSTGRKYITIKATDLVDALRWPEGVEDFQSIIHAYRQHREGLSAEEKPCPNLAITARKHDAHCEFCVGRGHVVTRSKTEILEPDEAKEAALALINLVREHEPDWNPFDASI